MSIEPIQNWRVAQKYTSTFPDLYLMAECDGVAPDLEELRDVEQDGQEDDGQDVIPEN